MKNELLIELARELAEKEGYELVKKKIQTENRKEYEDWKLFESKSVKELETELRKIDGEINQLKEECNKKYNEVKEYIERNEGNQEWCKGFVTHNAIKAGFVMMQDKVKVVSQRVKDLQLLREDIEMLIDKKRKEEAFERIKENIPKIQDVVEVNQEGGRKVIKILI
jgi:hypothetical protein